MAPSKDSVRSRILHKADMLLRQYGFTKTTVADIANELGMSPANIYNFFESKNAIIHACTEQNFAALKDAVLSIVNSDSPAFERLERLVLHIFRYHRDLLRNERHIFRLFLVATEEHWSCRENYRDFLLDVFQRLVAEGVERGEFQAADPALTAQTLADCLMFALHPHLHHQFAPDNAEERITAQLGFIANALHRPPQRP